MPPSTSLWQSKPLCVQGSLGTSHEEILPSPVPWKSLLSLGEPTDNAALHSEHPRVPAVPKCPSPDQTISAHLRHLSLQAPAEEASHIKAVTTSWIPHSSPKPSPFLMVQKVAAERRRVTAIDATTVTVESHWMSGSGYRVEEWGQRKALGLLECGGFRGD